MKFSLDLRISSPIQVCTFVVIVTVLVILISLGTTFLCVMIAGVRQPAMAYQIALAVPILTVPPVTCLIAYYAYRLSLAHQALFQLAHTDELTGLANRRYFFAQGNEQLASAQADEQACVLMLLDADDFKRINDTSGHAAGDEALCFLAQALKAHVNPADLVARLGGDEFAILRPAATRAEMTLLANQIRRHLAQKAFFYNGSPLWLSVSIGIADTLQAPSFEQLLRASDVALYQQKFGTARHQPSEARHRQPCSEQATITITQPHRLPRADRELLR